MNLKKYIKLKQEPQEITFTAEEEARYNSLVKRIEANEANAAEATVVKKHIKLWRILTPIATVVGAIAITLTCVFTMKTSNDFLYNEELIKSEESSFAFMQADTKYFNFNYIEPNVEQVFLLFDSASNDKLYYSIEANSELSTIELVVVINDKFNYKFEIEEETFTKQLNSFDVTYCSESSRGKPQINYRGWIKVQTETVYFDFVQIPALGDEAFFETIQQIIQVK